MKKLSLLIGMIALLLFVDSCKKEEQKKDLQITEFSFSNKNEEISVLLEKMEISNFEKDFFTRTLIKKTYLLTPQNSEEQQEVGILIPINQFKTDQYSAEIERMGYLVPTLNEFFSFLDQNRNLFNKIENFDYEKIAVSFCSNTDLDTVRDEMHKNYGGKRFSEIITFDECKKDILMSKEGSYSRKMYLRETLEAVIRKDLQINYNFVFAVKNRKQNNTSF